MKFVNAPFTSTNDSREAVFSTKNGLSNAKYLIYPNYTTAKILDIFGNTLITHFVSVSPLYVNIRMWSVCVCSCILVVL
jgi:hypothetical protein